MLDSRASYYAVIMTSESYPGRCDVTDVTTNQTCKMEMKEAGELLHEYYKCGNNSVIEKITFLINPSLIFSVLCLTANSTEYAFNSTEYACKYYT